MGDTSAEITWIDTADTPRNADEKRAKYAGMVSKNGLSDRYGVDILTVTIFGVEEHRIMLIDSSPGQPAPEFLRDSEFVLRRSREHKSHVSDHDFYSGAERTESPGRVTRTLRHATYGYQGEFHTVAEWARETGIPYGTLYARLTAGWAIGEALTRPVQGKKTG